MFELEFNRGKVDNLAEIQDGNNDSKDSQSGEGASSQSVNNDAAPSSPEPGAKNILLKGQMKYIDDIKAIMFLCSPV